MSLLLLSVVASAFPNAAPGACGQMVSRVHGNDGWWCGGNVLSVYLREALLMCLASSFDIPTSSL
ncbi:hypothetical protein [Vibrio vulnificus YJ016]|uniref:Secreted protein n=1 Tax=Vibrio vulnificus (strain YJ016) TaxID=196600 RepID=Q7MPJ0_VIBVY|nr:hypothetical protein [Vibrio vulnificus YJ016]